MRSGVRLGQPYLTMNKLLPLLLLLCALPAQAQHLLAPMDQAQTDHLRAYGLTYWCLQAPRGYECEWLLNYRGGAFVLPDLPDVRARAKALNVTLEDLFCDDLAPVERELVEAFRAFPPEQRGAFEGLIEMAKARARASGQSGDPVQLKTANE